jgi:Dual specificity phosphatase, catalytic domain
MQSIVGAVKIKDGLFVGDEFAAQDLEFIVANKVTHVVNCAGKQVPNHWEPIGVKYLTFNWMDINSQIVLDTSDKNFWKFYQFIELSAIEGTSALVHSVHGTNRSICVVASYLMKRFSWSLYKTLQFLSSRRGDLNLKPSLLGQLTSFEMRLGRQGTLNITNNWNDPIADNEEELLRNTFLNSQIGMFPDYVPEETQDIKNNKISWVEEDIELKRQENNHKFVLIKSCLKGAKKEEKKVMIPPKPLHSKRSISLNLHKNAFVKDDLRTVLGQKPSQDKNNPLIR